MIHGNGYAAWKSNVTIHGIIAVPSDDLFHHRRKVAQLSDHPSRLFVVLVSPISIHQLQDIFTGIFFIGRIYRHLIVVLGMFKYVFNLLSQNPEIMIQRPELISGIVRCLPDRLPEASFNYF